MYVVSESTLYPNPFSLSAQVGPKHVRYIRRYVINGVHCSEYLLYIGGNTDFYVRDNTGYVSCFKYVRVSGGFFAEHSRAQYQAAGTRINNQDKLL